MVSLSQTAFSIALVLMLTLGGLVLLTVPNSSASNSTHELGFWVDGTNVPHLTPTQFVSGYFGTPPYPEFAQMSMGFSAVANPASYWIGIYVPMLQQMAASYPNAKLMFQIFMVSQNATYGGVDTEADQIGNYSIFAAALAPYSSQIIGMGGELEYVTASHIASIDAQLRTITVNNGLQWLGNPSHDPTYPQITYVQWPWFGPEEGLINYQVSPPVIGTMIGYQGNDNYVLDGIGANAFPSVCTAADLPAITVSITTSPLCVATFNQLIVNHIINDILQAPGGRQYILLAVGYSSNGGGMTFTGATGTTGQTAMWDNPTLRQWIWDSPKYQSNFVLSTEQGTGTGSTATTLTVSCSPASVAVGKATTCKATVRGSGSVPTGTVAWFSNSTGTFSSAPCNLSRHKSYSTCSVKFTPTAAGSAVVLTANYEGSKNFPSAETYILTVTMKATKMTVSCTPTSVTAGSSTLITCTAKATGFFLTGVPTGAVSWYQAPYQLAGTGSVSFTSITCTLTGMSSTRGTCSVTMTGSRSGQVEITAEYEGDSNNQGGYGTAKVTINMPT